MSTADLATLGAIFVLVGLSALVSGSETAVTAASRAWMEEAARRGLRGAHLAARLLRDRERLVTAILIGNNLVNILATSLATAWLTDRLGGGGVAVAVATGLMTVVLVVLGEVLPKTWAIRRPEPTALRVAPVLALLATITTPFTALLLHLARLLGRLADRTRDRFALLPPGRFLRATIASWAERGLVSAELRELLTSVLRFDELEVRHVMVHRSHMVTLPAALPVRAALARIRTTPYSRFPVTGRGPDDLVGIVHVRHLLDALDESAVTGEPRTVADVMAPPWFVPETTRLVVQLRAFRERRRHMALVTDEYGAVQGLVTLEDVLEQVVGEIADEKEDEEAGPAVHRLADGSLVVPGTLPLADLARLCHAELPLEPVTVAGLVMEIAGRLPEVGEVVDWRGWRFEVAGREGPRITRVRVRPPRSAGEGGAPPAG